LQPKEGKPFSKRKNILNTVVLIHTFLLLLKPSAAECCPLPWSISPTDAASFSHPALYKVWLQAENI